MATMPQVEGVEHSYHELTTGVRVHVASAGPPDAPPMLALHGWPQHWWSWREVIGALGGEYRILCPDLRGIGWSGWPADGDFTKDALARDAVAVLDAFGLDRVRLVGHDWGGFAALLAALQAPERFSALLALSIGHPWVAPRVVALNWWRLLYQPPLAAPLSGPSLIRQGGIVRLLLEGGRRDERGWAAEELEAYLAPLRDEETSLASSLLYRHFLTREVPAAVRGRGAAEGRRLTVPTRLVCGGRDVVVRAFVDGLERHADQAEVEVVRGYGHFLPEECPDLVAERIRAM